MGKSERAQWADVVAKRTGAIGNGTGAAPKTGRVKGAKVTRRDGIRFASKLEADRYSELKLLQKAGEVEYFLRQVPFDVATGVTYRLDFLVVWARQGADGTCVSLEECKGFLTEVARVKLAAVQDRYGVHIRVLKRADVRRFG